MTALEEHTFNQPVRSAAWILPFSIAWALTCLILSALHVSGIGVPAGVVLAFGIGLLLWVCRGVFVPEWAIFARPVVGVRLVRFDSAKRVNKTMETNETNETMRTDSGYLALTFDDGPNPAFTPRILNLLAAHNARATFFVIGKQAKAHPELLMEIARLGHQIENHSYSHVRWAPFYPTAVVVADLEKAQVAIAQATGRRPRWHRPPFGVISPSVARAVRKTGLGLCCWSHKAGDGVPWAPFESALRRLEQGLYPGAILTLHDGLSAAHDAQGLVAEQLLERLLPRMKELGLRSVTLDELFEAQSETSSSTL